jgi:hypothetical protein
MPDMTASNGELNPMERRDMDDEINLFGMSVKTDESLLDDAVKFVHPDGSGQVCLCAMCSPRGTGNLSIRLVRR